MATEPSDPRGPLRPPPPKRPSPPPARASYSTEGRPVLRAVVWTAAVLSGGLLLVLLFFTVVGVINFYHAPYLALIAIAMAAFFIATMVSYARSERTGNTRWHDRERRGF